MKKALLFALLFFSLTTAHAACSGFRADRAYSDQQTFNPGAYNGLTWYHVQVKTGDDCSSIGATSKWKPVASDGSEKWITMTVQAWVYYNALGAGGCTWNPWAIGGVTCVPNNVVKFFRNSTGHCDGEELSAPIGTVGTFLNSMTVSGAAIELAKPNDTFEVCLFTTYANAWLNGHPSHVWWSGVVNP